MKLGRAIERFLFTKIEVWLAMLLLMLALMLLGGWSYAALRWEVFPYGTVVEIIDFLRGDPSDGRTLGKRLKASLGHNPAEFEASSRSELIPPMQLSPVRKAPNASGVMPEIDGMTFFNAGGPTRHFVILGSFAFVEQKTHWGAIAIDSEGVVHRAWAIRPERFEYSGAHIGLDVSEEGLVASNVNGVLTAYDWCGDKRWEAPWEPHPDGRRRDHDDADGYDWHHDIVAQDGRLYTFRGPAVMTVDATSGEIMSELHASDLIRWGWQDNLNLFDARLVWQNDAGEVTRENFHRFFLSDPFHFNKVDVLTKELAHLYPEFEARDMLISLRRLNLVIVVRPSEERIIWWRYGLAGAQHDATFVEGHIEVFDNNPGSDPPRPRIARFDLDSQIAETIFDLSRWKMIMKVRGNFERRGDHLLTVDDDAGRVIGGRLDGTIDFVFNNRWKGPDGELVPLQIRNATEVDQKTFARLEESCSR